MGICEEKVKKYLNKINKENAKMNIFLHLNEKAIEEARALDEKVKKTGKKGRLYGYVIAVKSNINVKGLIANCASKVLENYISGYDAAVIEKIKAEDGVIIGMVNMDEFAAGSSGENSAFGCCVNPACPSRVPGGSSSGSAVAVSGGYCDMALGSDTGCSIRTPASHCNIIGVKPSYGCVSRYGLIDLGMSLDQIGPLAKNVEDAALLLDVICGKDSRDTMTFEHDEVKLEKVGKINVGVLRVKGVDPRIQKLIDSRIGSVSKKKGWKVQEINIDYIDVAVQTYYPLVYAEFFSGTRRFDGRRYGYKIEEKCGSEVLRRVLGGSEITKAEFRGDYYKNALAIKEIVREEFEKVFEKYDCVLLPTCPGLPWKLVDGDKTTLEEMYAFDALTIPANLAGICSASIPAGKVKDSGEDVPVGMQVMCGKGQEGKMLSIAKEFEI